MGLGRCCSSGNGAILLVQQRPIWDRFRFSFLALAIVLCDRSVDYVADLCGVFREGLGYTERAGPMPRWVATAAAQNALDPEGACDLCKSLSHRLSFLLETPNSGH